MKSEELFEVLNDINENNVKKAETFTVRKGLSIRKILPYACVAAAFLVVLISIPVIRMITEDSAVLNGNAVSESNTGSSTDNTVITDVDLQLGNGEDNYNNPSDAYDDFYPDDYSVSEKIRVIKAGIPGPSGVNMTSQEFMEGEVHWEWWSDYSRWLSASLELDLDMDDYYLSLMEQMLVSDDENTVCSPLNTFIALSMLAEVSNGNTRRQILDMLGVSDIETLRSIVSTLWNSNYINTPELKSILSNSMWLNEAVTYNDETLNRLAESYYASSFIGNPGDPDMSAALRAWTDHNTGGLLEEYTNDLGLEPATIMALVSTVYYKAMWAEEFNEGATTRESFHGISGDSFVDMMHSDGLYSVYRTENFTSLGLSLTESGSMYFYLPNDGVDVNSLISDPDIIKAMPGVTYEETEDPNRSYCLVHMSVPKFNISYKSDLLEILKALGITDALDPKCSDFTPLTTDTDIYVSRAEHAAMVEIDEHGVTGAAYTALMLDGMGTPVIEDEIDFVLDRPFMFVITGFDGSILFSGIVRNI